MPICVQAQKKAIVFCIAFFPYQSSGQGMFFGSSVTCSSSSSPGNTCIGASRHQGFTFVLA